MRGYHRRATLWVSVRGMNEDAIKGRICLDDLKESRPLSEYAKAIPAEGSTVFRIDLVGELSRLADGKLNLALGDQLAVDWSALGACVAPTPAVGAVVKLSAQRPVRMACCAGISPKDSREGAAGKGHA